MPNALKKAFLWAPAAAVAVLIVLTLKDAAPGFIQYYRSIDAPKDLAHASSPLALLGLGVLCFGYAAKRLAQLTPETIRNAKTAFAIHVLLPLCVCLACAYAVFFLPVIDVFLPTKKAPPKYEIFEDDNLRDKNPSFIPDLVDGRRFIGREINASASVLRLDMIDDANQDQGFGKLYPDYAAAARAWSKGWRPLLPSVNAIDSKAKQFDDGLLAALHEAAARGEGGPALDLRAFLRDLLARVAPGAPAAAWIQRGLQLGATAGAPPDDDPPQAFYAWSPELRGTWRLVRYFMKPLPSGSPAAVEIAAAMGRDPALMARYARLLEALARLDAPGDSASFRDLAQAARRGRSATIPTVSLLPSPRSQEDILFQKVFAGGIPADADLTLALVQAIRSGKVDLKPGKDAGWYEYEVYALETFLLPERGREYEKLLLTKKYKKRMLRAFASILAKRRETHALRDMMTLGELALENGGPPPPKPLTPRLRLEPNPTYYLRMARSYAFLDAYLRTALPERALRELHGLKENGRRDAPLGVELTRMKELFYGFHLVSCEDLGMRPALLTGELESRPRAMESATNWLSHWNDDPDLAVDARFLTPIATDPVRRITRHWGALGIRAAILAASYARPPKWRLESSPEGAWTDAETAGTSWIILADEPAEVESSRAAFTRAELRTIADREQTKDKILAALSR